MKSALSLLLTLTLLLSLSLCAWGDTVSLPEDDFALRNRDKCTATNRSYYTNGSLGFVTGYDRPGGVIREVFPNEALCVVKWLYVQGDERWGCVEYDPKTHEFGSSRRTCWLPMEQLSRDYDYMAFAEDHADEIREEHASVRIPTYQDELVYWAYPGSGQRRSVISGHAANIDFTHTFTDPAGRRWGYQSYYRGHSDFWVCLDDPFNTELPRDENYVDPLAGLTPAASEEVLARARRDARSYRWPLVFGGVGVAAVAAGVLIRALRRKRRA